MNTHPSTYTGTITRISRTMSSRNGNPAFFIKFDSGIEFRTQSDSGVSYEIENYDPRYHPELVTVTLSRAGRITGIRSTVSA